MGELRRWGGGGGEEEEEEESKRGMVYIKFLMVGLVICARFGSI